MNRVPSAMAFVLCVGLSHVLAGTAGAQAAEKADALVVGVATKVREARRADMAVLARMISSDPSVRRRPDVHVAVGRLLQSETNEAVASARAAKRGDEREYGPDIDFYYLTLLPAAEALTASDDVAPEPELLEAMVNAIFNTGSPFANGLARQGAPALPAVLRLSASRDSSARVRAYGLLGEMLAADRQNELKRPLTDADHSQARATLRAGLQDREAVVRWEAIQGTVRAGDRESIPLLRFIAANDPDIEGPLSVRRIAAAAIRNLSGISDR